MNDEYSKFSPEVEVEIKKFSLFRKCDKHKWHHIDSCANADNPTPCPKCFTEDLQSQLTAAKREISRLEQALAETERQWRERGVRIAHLELLIAEIDCQLGAIHDT